MTVTGQFLVAADTHLLTGGELAPPVTISTVPLSAPIRAAHAVLTVSRARWGRPLDEVERDLLTLTHTGTPGDPGRDRIGRVRRTDTTKTPPNEPDQKGGTP